jgi:DNA repair protein RadA/Sms
MSKNRIKFICSNCGYESLRWVGKCPSCDSWNSFSEEIVEDTKTKRTKALRKSEVRELDFSETKIENRLPTNIREFDRVLGGGLIPGSVILIGGDPGIGKSTLVLQAADKIEGKVLYVSGEESINQLSLRAKRLRIKSKSILLLAETDLSNILDSIKEHSPEVIIIDSIQTMSHPDFENAPGTVTQIRECTVRLMQIAKSTGCSVFIVGHVTKEGYIAGPKVLEHIVDTVLQFEGEKNYSYRILRGQKNRFGSTNEIGIFEMHEEGLVEVKNPSEIFLNERTENITGSTITSSMEGTRPILLEVQALVTPSHYGNPQRVATGFDYRRLSILLAVLEKRAKLRLSSANVFLNMAGGIKIDEPAVDLAVCCAIASSLMDKPANNKTVLIGEVGLGGEIRGVGHLDKRIQEAEKLGFKKVLVPKISKLTKKSGIEIISIANINEAIEITIKSG